jgi:hypothetical protein
VARALANEPVVLLLDEPTAALDPAAAERILDLAGALAGEGLSIVLVTHQTAHAESDDARPSPPPSEPPRRLAWGCPPVHGRGSSAQRWTATATCAPHR